MTTDPLTLTFESFWNWVTAHPNCIVRAGTPEAVLYDDEDLHWHFATEGQTLLVQVVKGKRLMGEMFVDPELIAYVHGYAGDQEGEHVFELVSEAESDHLTSYFFVLTHGYENEQPFTPARVH